MLVLHCLTCVFLFLQVLLGMAIVIFQAPAVNELDIYLGSTFLQLCLSTVDPPEATRLCKSFQVNERHH